MNESPHLPRSRFLALLGMARRRGRQNGSRMSVCIAWLTVKSLEPTARR